MTPRPTWLRLALSGCTALILAWCWSRVPARLGTDKPIDFTDFYYAAKALAAGGDPYTAHLGRYIYPPLLATLQIPLATLPLVTASLVWSILNLGSVVALLYISARTAIQRFQAPADPTTVAVVTLSTLLLALEPVRWVIEQGNSDGFMALALVLAAVWSGRRPGLCALAIGLAANIKYQSLIALPYLMLRRRWRDAGGVVLFTLALLLLPAAVLGWRRNLDFLGIALSGVLRLFGFAAPGPTTGIQDVTFYRSISLTSAAARLAAALHLPTLAVPALVVLAATLCLAGAWVIYRRAGLSLWRHNPVADPRAAPVELLEWCGLIVAVLVFSPQTTTRHMLLAIPLHAVLTVLLLGPRPGVRRAVVVIGAVLFQLGTRLPPGGAGFEQALAAWRAVGGASWCLLAMFFVTLDAGLRARPAQPPLGSSP